MKTITIPLTPMICLVVGNKPTSTDRSTNMQANKHTQWVESVRRLITTLGVATLLAMGYAPVSLAQEQPEHPTGAAKVAPAVTLEDVAQRIEVYVKQESQDGAFKFEDKPAGKQLLLTLVRVHRERLSQVGPDMFFACADFKASDGNVYDLDFFVQGTTKDSLHILPDRTSVHKENGKERYTWAFNAQKGIWEQKPVGTKAPEHPTQEHP